MTQPMGWVRCAALSATLIAIAVGLAGCSHGDSGPAPEKLKGGKTATGQFMQQQPPNAPGMPGGRPMMMQTPPNMGGAPGGQRGMMQVPPNMGGAPRPGGVSH